MFSLPLVLLLLHLILVGTLVFLTSHFWSWTWRMTKSHLPKLAELTAGSASRCSNTGYGGPCKCGKSAGALIVCSSFYLNHVASLSTLSWRRECKEVESAVAAHASGTRERFWTVGAVPPLSVPACAACNGTAVIVGLKLNSVVLF